MSDAPISNVPPNQEITPPPPTPTSRIWQTQIKPFLKSKTGVLGTLVATNDLWRPILKKAYLVVDIGGNLQFIYGYIPKILNAIGSPLGRLMVVFFGLGLIALQLWRQDARVHKTAKAGASSEQQEIADDETAIQLTSTAGAYSRGRHAGLAERDSEREMEVVSLKSKLEDAQTQLAGKQALDEVVRRRTSEIEIYQNELSKRATTIEAQTAELVATRTSLKEAQAQVADQNESLEVARKEDQRCREQVTKLQRDLSSLTQVKDDILREKAAAIAEIDNLTDRYVAPKVDVVFTNAEPYRVVSETEGTIRRMTHTFPNTETAINIEVTCLVGVFVTGLRVEVVGGTMGPQAKKKLPLPEIVILPRMHNAPDERNFFRLARKIANESQVRLCSTNQDSEVLLDCSQDVQLDLIVRGEGTAERKRRISLSTERMRGGYGGGVGVHMLPDVESS